MKPRSHERWLISFSFGTQTVTSTRTALGAWAVLADVLAGCSDRNQDKGNTAMKGSVQHLNPDGLHKNPAYSQAVAVAGNVKTVYVGGQYAVDASGQVVGKDNLRVQTEQVLKNVETALAAWGEAGARGQVECVYRTRPVSPAWL
jgi:enamine deaminase RidA (YjgF/YER057c/UK114 family)